jgi:NitT/TauT family transport system substrate-binding protein
MSMKFAFFSLMLLVSGVTICGCLSPQPDVTTVTVAYQPTSSNGPLYIAKEEGYFAQQGINMEFVRTQSSTAAIPLLVSGDVGVSTGPLRTGLINAVAKGQHIRIVADKGTVTPGSCTAYALMVRKDLSDKGIVRNVSDLKGRKIAARDEGYDLFRVLDLGNLSSDDVETVEMDFTSIVPAFKNGAIDAALVTEPYVTQSINSDAAVVFVPAQDFLPDWPLPLYYGPAILDKDPELGRRFMVAYLQGVKQYNLGKTERNLAIIGNYTLLDRDMLNQTCWYPIAEDGNISRQPVMDYVDWMYAHKKITGKVNENELFDMSYVNYANTVLSNTATGGQKNT